MKKIVVEPHLFTLFPDFKRGVILVNSLDNRPNNEKIKEFLENEITNRVSSNCIEHEYIKAWNEAHTKFGSNPNKYPPSIKSLLKRIQSGNGFPFINSVVALFNYISIKYLVPCGGDDIDKIQGNLCLGISKGNEFFIPLGSTDTENPIAGEVIYFDDKTLNVMCRRWNWRNGDFTKITENSKQLVINIDGIVNVPKTLIESARDELAKLLIEQCNAELKTGFLDSKNNEFILN